MKLSFGVVLLTASPCLLVAGCIAGTRGTGTIPTVIVTPSPTTIPVNSTVTFTANSKHVDWTLIGAAYADLGTPQGQIGGSTFVYTAPATPPVYFRNDLPAGLVILQTQEGYGVALTRFTITAPSITVGVSPQTADVALGSALTIYGYAVGDANTQISAQVNGVTGGSAATGTIALAGSNYGTFVYTAPTATPITGSNINITIVSQADPTKTKTAVVTLH
jgi:hypothetical protein